MDLANNLRDLESIVQGKSNNLRMVEDGKSALKLLAVDANVVPVLRQKVISSNVKSTAEE